MVGAGACCVWKIPTRRERNTCRPERRGVRDSSLCRHQTANCLYFLSSRLTSEKTRHLNVQLSRTDCVCLMYWKHIPKCFGGQKRDCKTATKMGYRPLMRATVCPSTAYRKLGEKRFATVLIVLITKVSDLAKDWPVSSTKTGWEMAVLVLLIDWWTKWNP